MATVTPGRSEMQVDAALGTRNWRVTSPAEASDQPAGTQITLTITQTTTGATPPGAPNTLTLTVYIDVSTNLVRTYTLTPGSASQTVTFDYASDGNTTGNDCWGTFRMRLNAVRTSAGTYNVTSDAGAYSSPADVVSAGLSVNAGAGKVGWLRGTTTATQSLSNVSFGGAVPSPFAYRDGIFLRTTFAHVALALMSGTASVGSVRSGASNVGAGGATSDLEFSSGNSSVTAGRVNKGFPASATPQTTGYAIGDASLTGLPAGVLTTLTTATATFDPRPTVSVHAMQVNDSTYPTSPPNDSDAVTPKRRRADQSGHLLERIVNSRGEGTLLNYSLTLAHESGFSLTATGKSLGTINGQAGWTATMTPWLEGAPSGFYTKSITITTSDMDDASYWIGATDADDYLLVAEDSDLTVIAGGGPGGSAGSDISNHWRKGDYLAVGGGLLNTETREIISPDASPAPDVALFRLNQATGQAQYLKSDFTWANAAGVTYDTHALTVLADGKTYLKVFTDAQTGGATWGDQDLFGIVTFTYQGFPYRAEIKVDVVGAKNGHSAYSFDGLSLLGLGLK